jgi:GNAT superfamily N-acetyltransferase
VLDDGPIQVRRNGFLITTDRERIDPVAVLALLKTTFWAQDLKLEVLQHAIENSVSFAVFEGQLLVGFGRVVSDLSTYAYWTDVVVASTHRGRGLGHWLSECMLAHPQLQGLRRVALLTRDAAPLYARLGFSEGAGPLTYMERRS